VFALLTDRKYLVAYLDLIDEHYSAWSLRTAQITSQIPIVGGRLTMAKKLAMQRTEADRIADDAVDPVLKMLDDGEMSMQEIFDVLGWDSILSELFEIGDK
jgi:hypothetical protein